MAGLSFRVRADVDKVIQLRSEIEKLEKVLRNMKASPSSKEFKSLVKELTTNRDELAKTISSIEKTKEALDRGLSEGAKRGSVNINKLSEAIRLYNIEEKKIGQNVRDLRLEQRETAKGSEEYNNLRSSIIELQKEQNRYKDLLFQLREEKKRIQAANKSYIVSEKELEQIAKSGVRSIAEANEQNKRLRNTVKQIKDGDVEAIAQRRKYNQIIERNTEYIRRNSDAMVKQKMDIGGYKQAIRDAWVGIKTGTDTTKNFGIVARNTGNILKTNLSGGLKSVQSGVSSMIKGFVGANLVMKAIGLAVGAIRSGFNTMIDFEQANANLRAILRTSKDGIKDLEFDAKRLGATTRYTAGEITGLQIEMAKLGFKRFEILNSTEAVLKFATATGSNLSDAAKLAGATLRAFNLDTSKTEDVVASMAVSTTKSALNFDYLSTAMSTIAPVAKSFNFSLEDTLALLGQLADAGFDSSSAATATRNILLNLADANGKLAKSLGERVKNLPELVNGLVELRDKGVDLSEALELTDKRSVSAFNTFLSGAEKIEVLRNEVTGVISDLDEMVDTMEDTTVGAIASLSSAWEGFILSLDKGSGWASNAIRGFADAINDLRRALASKDDNFNEDLLESANSTLSAMRNSGVIERIKQNAKQRYNALITAGKTEAEAEEIAKNEIIKAEKKALEEQNKIYAEAISKRADLKKEQKNTSWHQALLYANKTSSYFKKNIKSEERKALEAAGWAKYSQSIIDMVSEVNLAPKDEGGTTHRQTLDPKELEKIKKAKEEQAKELLSIDRRIEKDRIDLMEEGYEKQMALIEYNHQGELRAIEEQRKKAGLGANDAKVEQMYQDALKRRENAQSKLYKDIEDKYRTHEQILSDINAKYDADRRALELANNKEAIVELEKARNEELSKVSEPLEIDLSEVFGELEKHSVEYLRLLREKLSALIKSSSSNLTATDMKHLAKGLTDIDNLIIEKDPFNELKPSLDEYLSSQKKLNKARSEYNKLKGTGTKDEADAGEKLADALERQANAQHQLNKAIRAGSQKGGEIVDAGNSLMGMLGDLGIKTPKKISDILGGYGKMFDSLGQIDVTKPMSIISGVFGAIGGFGKAMGGFGRVIGGIFGSSRKARRENRQVLAILEAQNRELEMQYKVRKAIAEVQSQSTVFGTDDWNKSKLIAKQYEDQYKSLQKTLGKLNQGEVVTGSYVSKSFWRSKRKDRWEGLLDAYPELIEASGRFNIELAESILNTKKLDKEGQETLTEAISKANELEGAYEQLASQLESVFGQLSNSIMDNFIKAFKAGTDAMEGIYTDAGQMIEGLAKQMVYSMAFGNVMQQANEQMKAIQLDLGLSDEDRYKKMTEILGSTLGGIEGSSKLAMDLLEWTKEEAAKQGFEIFKGVEDQFKVSPTVGQGFETMTQDQASSLEGRFLAVYEVLRQFREDYNRDKPVSYEVSFATISQLQSRSLGIIDEIRTIQVNSFLELQGIRENTGSTVKELRGMGETLERIDRNTRNLR